MVLHPSVENFIKLISDEKKEYKLYKFIKIKAYESN